LGAAELIERSGARRGKQAQRNFKSSGEQRDLRCVNRPSRTDHWIRCHHGRLLQEDLRLREAPARLRAVGRALQLGGQFLIRLGCRLSPVPRDPLRPGLRIGCLGQYTVHGAPILHRGGTVNG